MKTILHSAFIGTAIFINLDNTVYAQNIPDEEKKAFEILDKAMGILESEDGYAIYFEGIAFGIQNPTGIFALPVYKVQKGGFMINDGDKFEIQLGIMKALCDGKIMVLIDEIGGTMMIDSLRDKVPGDFEQTPDIQKLIEENFGIATLEYQGFETINKKECHKIKAYFPDDASKLIYYWVETNTDKLYLMAERQGEAYDVYWIKKITKAPKGHKYNIYLPDKELESYYGYEVFDFRYYADYLKGEGY